MTRELTLSQLTMELTDFLGLPEDLDLPRVQSVSCQRTHKTGWSVTAFVTAPTDAERYEAMTTWAKLSGGAVEVSAPYAARHQPSGMQRTLTVRIVVAQVPITLEAGVDGLFTAPATRAVSA